MSFYSRIFAIILIALYFIILRYLLSRKKLELRYTLLWFFAAIMMLIFVIWPEIVMNMADLLKVQIPSNFMFAMCVFFIIVIMISLTSIISSFSVKIKRLTQVISLNEERIRELEKIVKREKENE